MRIKSIGKIAGLIAAAAMLMAGRSANAALEIDLGIPNSDISGYTGPFGKLTLTLVDSTHATAVLSGYAGYNFSSFGIQVNATSFTADTPAGNGTGTYSIDLSNKNQDGFGKFNLIVDQTPSGSPGSSILSVNIVNTGGTWASQNDILNLNATGYLAAGHVIVLGGSVTGFAGNGVAVPEPSTIVAAALLLLPFGASTIRYFRKSRTAQ